MIYNNISDLRYISINERISISSSQLDKNIIVLPYTPKITGILPAIFVNNENSNGYICFYAGSRKATVCLYTKQGNFLDYEGWINLGGIIPCSD